MRQHATQRIQGDTDPQLRAILRDVLGLRPLQVERFAADTELFGALPELDSMAVAGLLPAGVRALTAAALTCLAAPAP